MSVNLTKVARIAEQVREWAENYQRQHPHDYFDNLCGLCGKASAVLCHVLQRAGIPAIVCSNNCHAFVMVDNYWLVDITSTQFSACATMPSVVIISKRELITKYEVGIKTKYHFWQASFKDASSTAFISRQSQDRGWPPEQTAVYEECEYVANHVS